MRFQIQDDDEDDRMYRYHFKVTVPIDIDAYDIGDAVDQIRENILTVPSRDWVYECEGVSVIP